jgi:hypothetical protein
MKWMHPTSPVVEEVDGSVELKLAGNEDGVDTIFWKNRSKG